MSDLYLELRRRIPVVAAKTHIGTDLLQSAQDAVGLSNERIAHEIPVSEKTWRRWKEDGAVPTYALPKIAQVLRLDLVEAPRPPLELHPEPSRDGHLAAIAEALRDLLAGQEEILARLARLESPTVAAPPRRRARPKQKSS